MRIFIYLAIFAFSFLIFFSCSPAKTEEGKDRKTVFLCDVEKVNPEKRLFSEALDKDIYFQNVETQSDDFAYSGKYSSKLFPGRPYGLTVDIENVKADDYIQVTAWRKSKNDGGVVVIDGGNGFYQAGKHVLEEQNGWQKIFVEYFVPPNFYSGKVKIFVWNNSPDTVYFDDMEILLQNKKDYPEYKDEESVNLYIDSNGLDKLQQKRITAFEKTMLVSSDEDYTNLVFFDGDYFLNGKCRLKGDWLDHIQGDKWSLRVKLKKDFAWKHMRTFSVQNPSTRNFVHEWLAHKIFEQEGVLTTRYGFVPLRLNNKSLGIYAWEEHFEKQLVESKNRREGPILRFDESIFWQQMLEGRTTGRQWDIDYFNATPVIPFKQGQLVADSMKIYLLEEGQKLMLQYKNQTQPVSKIFDVDKLARYYSLIDLTQAYHGFTWHNQRFYYNPVTCLLEPIAFDGYIENGIYKRFDQRVTGMVPPFKLADYVKDELMLFHPFADSLFIQKYIAYLSQYSSPEFMSELNLSYREEADSISAEIYKEFPYYSFDFKYIEEQAKWIQDNLDDIEKNAFELGSEIKKIDFGKFRKEYTTDVNPNLIPLMVQAYYNRDKKQIDVLNFHNGEVKLLGALMSDRLPESFDPTPLLEPFKGIRANQVSISVEAVPAKILFSIDNKMYETEVHPWKYSSELTTRQIAEKRAASNFPVTDGRIIFEGSYTFSSDVVIPSAVKEVVFMPGTKINLTNGAGFFSFVPVKMQGTSTEPVKIFSSDKSAQGFNIIQPNGKSVLNFAEFQNLSNLQKGGWQTPAAVSFYEADVEIKNSVFASNVNCDDALNVVRSDFYVENCRFENTFADAFDSDFCTGEVKNCLFKNTGNDAIDFSGSQIKISGCEMYKISDKAISGGEHSFLTVTDCKIDKANIGVASKDLSELVLDKIEMNQTVYGLVAFVKKAEYGPGKIVIENLKLKRNMIFHQIEEGSVLILNGKTIYGKEKKLVEKLYQ
ncbi:right-handed parallel beta-helix repeat-containing protein [Maribellus maritimus]|uniref:right-handed parallel beta-helix repeat-containing protein n=1 Tax=Maribellus maritimus TaxID=2870838 RepID=UPI001EEC7529|nr:right-handed parallel beta-helix repeat-containing protein [Maribellus maritimus]MCG6186601.1 CotH kinase family protein [Maribellus maritimus]